MAKTARKGSGLRIEIRMALSALGRPVDSIDTRRMTIPELEELASKLHAEFRASNSPLTPTGEWQKILSKICSDNCLVVGWLLNKPRETALPIDVLAREIGCAVGRPRNDADYNANRDNKHP